MRSIAAAECRVRWMWIWGLMTVRWTQNFPLVVLNCCCLNRWVKRRYGIQLFYRLLIQRDDTGEVQAVELVVRGRHKEVDRRVEDGESNTTKVTSTNSYAKLTIKCEVLGEVDLINNMVEIVAAWT